MLLVDRAHQCGGWRKDVVDKDEDGLFRRELDAFADNIDELADGEVLRVSRDVLMLRSNCGSRWRTGTHRWDEVLLLVDGGDIALLCLFADHGDTVGVLLPDALCLGFALVCMRRCKVARAMR